jgi:hypothetical protein
MKHDLKVVGEYVSMGNVNMILEMSQLTAKAVPMSEDKLKAGFRAILEDLNSVEENLKIRLGSRGVIQRKHENFTNNFLLSMLKEAAKLRKCLG